MMNTTMQNKKIRTRKKKENHTSTCSFKYSDKKHLLTYTFTCKHTAHIQYANDTLNTHNTKHTHRTHITHIRRQHQTYPHTHATRTGDLNFDS